MCDELVWTQLTQGVATNKAASGDVVCRCALAEGVDGDHVADSSINPWEQCVDEGDMG